MPDVRTTRGAIAAKPGRASVHAGVVMRNGVADAVAPAGTIAARLAAMRGAAVQAPAPAATHAVIQQQGWVRLEVAPNQGSPIPATAPPRLTRSA